MADHFTTAAFVLEVDAHEAELLDEVIEIAEQLAEGFDPPTEAQALYAGASSQFHALFPIVDADKPFAGLLALFEDPSFPSPDSLVWHVPVVGNPGKRNVHVEGENVAVFSVARLLQKVCVSALPFRFGWAHTSLPMRVDAFGGGYLEVGKDRIVHLWSPGDNPDAARLVIALKDEQCGLLFWNKESGFGSLKEASVFTQDEADSYRLPSAHGARPGWLELPPTRDVVPAAA
ncbi:MAG TPA: hypothetical protein VF481_17110 [Novosphingobium sp.]